MRLVLTFHAKFFEHGKTDKAGRRAPVAGQSLHSTAGEALGQAIILQLPFIVVQITQTNVVEQVGAVPRVARTVGHDADGAAVDVQTIHIRLNDRHLAGAVGKCPMQRRNGSQHRLVQQSDLLLQGIHHLLHAVALCQHMVDHKRRQQSGRSFPHLLFKMGKFAVIQLTAHQSLLVDALIQHRCGGNHQKSGSYCCIGRGSPLLLTQVIFHCRAAHIIAGAARDKADFAALRQPVEVHIPSPQMLAVLCLPTQSAASGVHHRHQLL